MKSKIVTDSDDDWAALVPEFLVRDLATSLEFYLQGCGFRAIIISQGEVESEGDRPGR